MITVVIVVADLGERAWRFRGNRRAGARLIAWGAELPLARGAPDLDDLTVHADCEPWLAGQVEREVCLALRQLLARGSPPRPGDVVTLSGLPVPDRTRLN